MNKSELISSIKRYVHLYYDVEVDETDVSFNKDIVNLFLDHDDSVLEEYWDEYKKLENGETDNSSSNRVFTVGKDNQFRQAVERKEKQMMELESQ